MPSFVALLLGSSSPAMAPKCWTDALDVAARVVEKGVLAVTDGLPSGTNTLPWTMAH